MKCADCKHDLEQNWLFCPFCGHKISALTGQAKDSRFGSYGSGVRAQILELAVRQAMAGGPWKERCAGVMQANQITVEEVEAEVHRRTPMPNEFFPAPTHIRF